MPIRTFLVHHNTSNRVFVVLFVNSISSDPLSKGAHLSALITGKSRLPLKPFRHAGPKKK